VAKILGVDIPFFSRNASRNPLAYLFSFVFSIQILVIAYLAFFVGLTYMNASKAKAAPHTRSSSSRTVQ
jgi:hypothetical protein